MIFLCEACSPEAKKNDIAKEYAAYREKLQMKFADSLKQIEKLIQNGDIITRTGNDYTSESLRSLNRRDKTFSHCGIAYKEGDSVFVYHAIGGEWNPEEKIRKESFFSFVNIQTNNSFGIFSYDSAAYKKKEFFSVVKNWFNEGIKFDMKFDLKTDDRMYCAEFVAKALEKSSHHKILIDRSRIGGFEFIGIDDITQNPLCSRKYIVQYK